MALAAKKGDKRAAAKKTARPSRSSRRAVPKKKAQSVSKKAVKSKAKPKLRARQHPLLRALRAAAVRERMERPPQLERHELNPIIEPRGDRIWEMKATFNPGALYADKRVHLLYRAIGGSDMSVLGYASSDDGVHFTERTDAPAFVPPSKPEAEKRTEKAPVPYPGPSYCSGGGWNGGCEDPRLTLIENTVYLMYTAFDGWGSIRIALSSIALKDFLGKRWEWKRPALLSPQGEINKNWVLFPEKINGKFAILHSLSPNVLIDYFDDLNDFDEEETILRSRYDRVSRTGAWDSWIRGAGPPPIKTKLGWLLFYHAMDVRDPNRYKLGVMVLDLNNPAKILYRSRSPILEPDADYENNGKSGVVYSCGAVVKDGELYVYYGGGDAVSCVAMANLDTFLEELKRHGAPKLAAEIKPKSKSKNAYR